MGQTANKLDTDRRYSIAEYFELIDQLETKYEYHNGKLVDYRMMAGASDQHALIAARVARHVGNALDDKRCRPYSSDLILRIPRTPFYRFADLTVICGPIEHDPEDPSKNKAVLNPTLLVEILAETSERDDRGAKFQQYMTIPSLQEYVLISQERPEVETFLRQSDGSWRYERIAGLDAVVRLRSIEVELRLVDIFAGVSFSTPVEAVPAQGTS